MPIPTRQGYRVAPGTGTGLPTLDAVSRASGAAYQASQENAANVLRASRAAQAGNLALSNVAQDITNISLQTVTAHQQARQRDTEAQARIDAAQSAVQGRDLAAQAWLDIDAAHDDAVAGPPDQAVATYRERVGQIQNQYAPTDNPEAGAAFDSLFTQRARVGELSVRTAARKGQVEQVLQTGQQALDGFQQAAFGARSGQDRDAAIQAANDTIDLAVAKGALTAPKAEELKGKWRADLEKAEAQRLVEADPARAAELLRGGAYSSIDVGQREQFIIHAERLGAAREEDAARQVKETERATVADAKEALLNEEMDLRARIAKGEAGMEDVEKLRVKYAPFRSAGGAPIVQPIYDSLHGMIERRDRQSNIDGARIAGIQDTLQQPSETRGSLKQGDADFYFERVVAPAAAANPEAGLTAISGFIAQSGLVPTAVQQSMKRAMEKGVDAETRADMAGLMDRIRTESPLAYNQIPAAARRSSELFNTYRQLMGDDQKAADKVDSMLNVPDAERKVREQRLTPTILRQQGDKLISNLDGKSRWSDFGLHTSGVADPLLAAFYRLYTDAYVATGDEVQAHAEASKTIDEQWGVSKLGDGQQRLLFLAPEVRYGTHPGEPDKDTAWMQDQLVADVQAAPGVDAAQVDSRGLIVLSDPQSASRGTYRVIWKDTLQPVYGAGGSEMRWAPDWKSSPVRASEEAAHQAEIGRVRALNQGPIRQNVPNDLGQWAP